MLKIIVALAWPTVLEGVLQTFVSYVDSAMVGRIGPAATAIVGMSTPVTWLINSIMIAAGVGFMAYIARANGAGNSEKVREASAQAVTVALILGAVMEILTLGISPFLPGWMGLEKNLRHRATLYFAATCLPMLFRSVMLNLGAVLRADGDTKTPLKVNLIMNIVNVVMNVIFIYPARQVHLLGRSVRLWGMGYGAVGAGIGTGIAYIVGGCLMWRVVMHSKTLSPKGESFRPDGEILRPVFKVGLPVAMESLITCVGHVVFSAMVTRLGTVAFAAHTIALTAEQAFYIPGYGMQAAAATLSGNMLGAEDEAGMQNLTKTFIRLIVIVMALSGGLLFVLAPQVMHIFTKDPDVIKLGTNVLRLVSVSEPIFGMAIILEGLFSGVGDTLMPFVYAAISMWGVRIFGTYLCINIWDLGLNAVWLCMIANNVSKGILLGTRYKSGKWNPLLQKKLSQS